MNKTPIPFTPSPVAIGAVVAATQGREVTPKTSSSPRISAVIPVPRPTLPSPPVPELSEQERWNLEVDRRNAKRRLDKLLTKIFGNDPEVQDAINTKTC